MKVFLSFFSVVTHYLISTECLFFFVGFEQVRTKNKINKQNQDNLRRKKEINSINRIQNITNNHTRLKNTLKNEVRSEYLSGFHEITNKNIKTLILNDAKPLEISTKIVK